MIATDDACILPLHVPSRVTFPDARAGYDVKSDIHSHL